MIATGYILHFPLPRGTNKSLSLWSLSRHEWGTVHFWISLALLAVLLTHLALHWQWVVTVVARQLHLATSSQERHIRSGVITLLAVTAALGAFAWIAEVSVRELNDPCCPPSETTAAPPTVAKLPDQPPTAERPQVNFWNEVYPILEASCLRCHGPRRAQGDFRIDRQRDYFGKDGKEPLVVPGKSAESPLIAIVSGQRTDMAMAASHKLPEREVAALRAWIDAGAEWPEKRDDE
jgi:mono/diheme cytochrome c family protein